MPFCTNCGTDVRGKFCGRCGSPMAAPIPPPESADSHIPVPEVPQTIRGERIASALCYLVLPTGVVLSVLVVGALMFLVLKPFRRSRVVRFHAFQSVFLGLTFFIANIVLEDRYPDYRFAFTPVSPFHTASVLFWYTLLVATFFKLRMVVPLLGQLAEKLA